MTVFYIILSVFLFGLLIFLHEGGHFVTAKLSGVQVNEFSLFMGPAIWKKQKGETLYALRCIPIGGYCAMEGEDDDSENPRAFRNAKVWKRIIILAAGSFMNALTGLLIVLLLVSFTYSAIPGTTLSGFHPDYAYHTENDLQTGDRFVSIDGERVYVNSDIAMLLSRSTTGVYDIVVERDGKTVELSDYTLKAQKYDGQLRYGFNIAAMEKTVGGVLAYSWNSCVNFARLVRLGLQDLITGRAGLSDMSGPVGIVKVVTDAGKEAQSIGAGVLNVLYLFAFIAVNLAVMNMLPIPALDGGRIVCLLLTTLIEKIIGRKLNPKYEGYLHAGFLVLLLLVMAVVTFKDIFSLFGG